MSAKISMKAREAFMQYSKRMCTRVTIFWMLYRLVNFIVLLIRPEIGNALSDLCAGIDTVMIVNMGAYTANSSTEKVAIAYTKRNSLYKEKNEDDDGEEEDDSSADEGDENG